jgi:tetratricopeptide (TPR) repeat protein
VSFQIKASMLRASLVVFVVILIVGFIWSAGSKLNDSNREAALVTAIPIPGSKPIPTQPATVSLLTSPPPRVNWKRSLGYAALHSIRGLDFYKKSDYGRAISEYTEAIESDPNNDSGNASVYYYRGLAYYHKKKHDNAIRDFNRAILLNPDKAIAYYYRGLAHYQKNEYDNAIRDLNEAILLEPRDPTAYYYRGVVYHEQGKDAQAQADFENAKQLGYARPQ